jgi:hypothetical protein
MPSGRIRVWVTNNGAEVGTVRVRVFRRHSNQRTDLERDSDAEIGTEDGPPSPRVPLNGSWVWEFDIKEGGWFWVRIQATSSTLIPSIEFHFDWNRDPTVFYTPGDFAVFRGRVRLLPAEPFDDDPVIGE